MFDYIQYAYKSFSKSDDKKPQLVVPIMSQDQLRTQLNNPVNKKPDAYKSSQSSSLKFN